MSRINPRTFLISCRDKLLRKMKYINQGEIKEKGSIQFHEKYYIRQDELGKYVILKNFNDN